MTSALGKTVRPSRYLLDLMLTITYLPENDVPFDSILLTFTSVIRKLVSNLGSFKGMDMPSIILDRKPMSYSTVDVQEGS